MPTTIATIRARVRQDLHDEDSAAYRWTDAVLDRHIGRAAGEYSLFAPLEQKTTLTATPGSRDVSIASLSGLIEIEAVEWPVGEFPPRRVAWSQWQTTITLDVVERAFGRGQRLRLLDEAAHARWQHVDAARAPRGHRRGRSDGVRGARLDVVRDEPHQHRRRRRLGPLQGPCRRAPALLPAGADAHRPRQHRAAAAAVHDGRAVGVRAEPG